jgi:hypothetical protein
VEDQTLSELVKCLGPSDWTAIAFQMPGRTPRQCRDRWKGYLSPTLKTDAWTADEDEILMQQWEILGPRWSLIAAHVKGRSEVAVRNRIQLLDRRKNRDLTIGGFLTALCTPAEEQPVKLAKLPSFQMPEAVRVPLTTRTELEAFFNTLRPLPSQKSGFSALL